MPLLENRGFKSYDQGSRQVEMRRNSVLFFFILWKGKGEIESMLMGHLCVPDTVGDTLSTLPDLDCL